MDTSFLQTTLIGAGFILLGLLAVIALANIRVIMEIASEVRHFWHSKSTSRESYAQVLAKRKGISKNEDDGSYWLNLVKVVFVDDQQVFFQMPEGGTLVLPLARIDYREGAFVENHYYVGKMFVDNDFLSKTAPTNLISFFSKLSQKVESAFFIEDDCVNNYRALTLHGFEPGAKIEATLTAFDGIGGSLTLHLNQGDIQTTSSAIHRQGGFILEIGKTYTVQVYLKQSYLYNSFTLDPMPTPDWTEVYHPQNISFISISPLA